MQPEMTGGRLPDVAPFDKRIELEMEKEMLGVYLTDHPLNNYKEKMEQISTLTADDIAHLAAGETGLQEGGDEAASALERSFARDQSNELHDGMRCIMSGMIAGKKTLITKNNKMMAFLDLEDLFGLTEVVVFPNVYERCLDAIHEGSVVAIRGTPVSYTHLLLTAFGDPIVVISDRIFTDFSYRQIVQTVLGTAFLYFAVQIAIFHVVSERILSLKLNLE